jgi:hypothetical protein
MTLFYKITGCLLYVSGKIIAIVTKVLLESTNMEFSEGTKKNFADFEFELNELEKLFLKGRVSLQ